MSSQAQMLPWWFALRAAVLFRDGALDIESDALSVTGGGTVNLRVRLTERPRSDVTVALSETSALISLGAASLTFTQANWDQYQTVVVSGPAGNRSSIALPAGRWSQNNPGTERRWSWSSGAPQVDSGLGASRYLWNVAVTSSGQSVRFTLSFADSATPDFSSDDDLSSLFETQGTVTVTVGNTSFDVPVSASNDTAEPYQWHDGELNAAQAAAADALFAAIASATAGNIVLRDYAGGDATISLSASGPDEYDGKTGSATVSVS